MATMVKYLGIVHKYSWADFFPGEGKNFPGGQKPTFCLKNNQKDTIFPQKV
jgi:hypothetical protein